jgi:hypothetical protein
MAPTDPDPRVGFSGQEPPPLPPPPPFEVATILDDHAVTRACEEDQQGTRRHPRELAPPCRPILVRVVADQTVEQATACFSADILDISLGGLCLLITDHQDLCVGQLLALDFGDHRLPEAMQHHGPVQARLRWFVRSGPVTTMGVGFVVPLPELPELR